MRVAALALALAACAPGSVDLAADEPAARTWLEGATNAGGVLVVQVQVPADAHVEMVDPVVEGLTFHPKGDPVAEQIGEWRVITHRFRYGGYSGVYEIPAIAADWSTATEGGVVESTPIWIDLGQKPPREGTLADIEEPDRVWTVPWTGIAVFSGLVLLFAGGLAVAFRRPTPEELAPPPVPPGLRAIRAWEKAWRDPTLDDHGKALAIAAIFRDYAEEVLSFPATAWTTSEILEHLKAMPHLPEGNIPRAKRLLRATDRIKFAEASARSELFEDLDADLRAFVGSTRPNAWEQPGGTA